jgi:hypothetical protein
MKHHHEVEGAMLARAAAFGGFARCFSPGAVVR